MSTHIDTIDQQRRDAPTPVAQSGRPWPFPEKVMTRDEILAFYMWATGDCFRCARTRLPTARLAEIDTPAGVRYDIRACQDCVIALETERQRYAERTGREYRPGQLGS